MFSEKGGPVLAHRTALHEVKQMSVNESTDKNVSDARDASEFGARQVRAVEEYLTVMPDAVEGEGMVKVVSQSGEEYIVDAVEERCECPDFEHREGDEDGRCKHIYRARWATGRDALPVDLVEAVEMEPNFGVFVDESEIRYAATDGGAIEADDEPAGVRDPYPDEEEVDTSPLGTVDRDTEADDADECEECAELPDDDLPCFECYMEEKGYSVNVGGDD
jgi:hypothetical protein